MTAQYISLTFGPWFLVIAWVVLGLPLLGLLSIARAWAFRGKARRTAVATLAAVLAVGAALWFMLEDEGGHEPFIALSVALLGIAWLGMAITAERWRLWPDLVVLILPTAIGLWAWMVE